MPTSTTNTVQDTLNWASAFIVQRPSAGVGGFANEPALTTANKILQTILAPPFRFPWNRVENSTITTSVGVTDYKISIPTFGWLEKATISNLAMTPTTVKEIEVFQVLAVESKQNQPQKVAPILDDNNGNITFRLMPAPDAPGATPTNYTVTLTYQNAPPVLPNLGALWAPIPDKYSFLYETAMLAHLQLMYSPQLYALNMEMFFKQLVGISEGLTETEKNIFLEDKLRELRMQTTELTGARQGKAVRQ
jgi:hypothetical protein